jgi:acyl-coenzyme A synthetase/AMP-(fatty) acid ligase
LHSRSPDALFAQVQGESVSWGQFLAEAKVVASELPDGHYVINLCEDRYHFSLGFAASLIRGFVTLLPPDRGRRHLLQLERDYPGAVILTERLAEPVASSWGVARPVDLASICQTSLDIEPTQTVVIGFTSGSTGVPQAHVKTWGALCESARLIDIFLRGMAGVAILATVPAQHMYGLELSILLPLCLGAVLQSAKPFYPADIAEALATTGRPRILVTTPVHLRALIRSELSLPPVDFLVSATSPLDAALAGICEQRFEAPLLEIYGCTEAGSLAGRRPVQTESWCLFESLELQQESGQTHFVVAPYLPVPVLLNDALSIIDERHFTLEGRSSDLINIAGKRTSLSALSHALLAIPGVDDGAFFLPDDTEMGTTRFVVFVVAPTLSSHTILEALRTELDAAFVPRAVHKLDRLPRSETGKLSRQALIELMRKA